MPAVRSTVSEKKRRSAAELEQPHGLLAVDWTDQARPVALRRSDSWKCSRADSSALALRIGASRRAPSIEGSSHSDVIPAGTSSGIRSCTVAGPSTAGT